MSSRRVETFRTLFVSVWETELRGASDEAIVAYMRLRTGPESSAIPGVVLVGRAALAEALAWKQSKMAAALDELGATGRIVADWQARLVWIPRAAVEGAPDNPNQVSRWRRYWPLVPECALKGRVRSELRQMLEERGGTFLVTFDEACPEGSSNLSGNVPLKVVETGSGSGSGRGNKKGREESSLADESRSRAIETVVQKCEQRRIAAGYGKVEEDDKASLRDAVSDLDDRDLSLTPAAYSSFLGDKRDYYATHSHSMRCFLADFRKEHLPDARKQDSRKLPDFDGFRAVGGGR